MDALTRLAASAAAGLALVLALAAAPAAAQACADVAEIEAAEDAGIHAPLDRLVRAHVREGDVRYDCLERDESLLDGYLAALAAADPGAMTRDERLALWINAYNAFTLKLILEHYPGIASIKDIPRGDRWKAVRWDVGGTDYSLDQIEHEILRPRFEEPRIHFAVNCASLSCPDLRAEAYVAARIDAQLEDATRRFLQDRGKGARAKMVEGWLYGVTPTLFVSSLFDWFEEDFTKGGGTVVDFVEPYLADDAREFVRKYRGSLAVDHLDYDWSLNGR